MTNVSSFWVILRGLTRQCLVVLSLAVIAFLGSGLTMARAEADGRVRVVIELPIYGQVLNRDFIAAAERLATDEIRRQFRQPLNHSILEVVVLGVRNGEVIPVITTAVSRNQWRINPQIGVWTRYNDLSYALLHRNSEDTNGSSAASVSRQSDLSRSNNTFDPIAEVEQAYQEGRLSLDEYVELVDELD